MYIKETDKAILQFISDYGAITINMCADIFYTNMQSKYGMARRRLSQLFENKYIKKATIKTDKNEMIYYMDRIISHHDLYVLKVYAELVGAGLIVKDFITKFRIENTMIANFREIDGICDVYKPVYKDEKTFYTPSPIIIEIDLTHKTDEAKIKDIYESNFIQQYYKNKFNTSIKFPKILRFSHVIPKDKINLPNIQIYDLTFDMKDIIPIVLSD